jgi:hypothetical protein
MIKVCPIRANNNQCNCLEGLCAWFDDKRYKCALLLIAVSLYSIDETLRAEVFK